MMSPTGSDVSVCTKVSKDSFTVTYIRCTTCYAQADGNRPSAVSEETPTSELLPCLVMQLSVDTGCRSRYVLPHVKMGYCSSPTQRDDYSIKPDRYKLKSPNILLDGAKLEYVENAK